MAKSYAERFVAHVDKVAPRYGVSPDAAIAAVEEVFGGPVADLSDGELRRAQQRLDTLLTAAAEK